MYKCTIVLYRYFEDTGRVEGGGGGFGVAGSCYWGLLVWYVYQREGGGEGSLVYSVSGMLGHDEMMILRIHTCNQGKCGVCCKTGL